MPVEPIPTGEFRMIQQRHPAYTTPEMVADPAVEETRAAVGVGDIRLVTMLFGGLVGAGLAVRSYPANVDERNQWLIFLLVATLLGIAAGESFGFGLSRWAEVKQFHSLKRWRIWL